jgi:hypothetical protein
MHVVLRLIFGVELYTCLLALPKYALMIWRGAVLLLSKFTIAK